MSEDKMLSMTTQLAFESKLKVHNYLLPRKNNICLEAKTTDFLN